MPEILVFGEGPTDYGKPGSLPDTWEQGPVQTFIRNSVNQELSFSCVRKDTIKDIKILSRRKPKGKGIAALKLCLFAQSKKYNKIIMFSDADREQGTKNNLLQARRRFEKVYEEITGALEYLRNNQGISLIPMIALKMIESWLLSDEDAFETCYGKKPDSPVLPEHPELIWGRKDDHQSNYPKNYLRRVLAQFCKEPCQETYYEIAEHIDIETLRSKCYISFSKFYEDVQTL